MEGMIGFSSFSFERHACKNEIFFVFYVPFLPFFRHGVFSFCFSGLQFGFGRDFSFSRSAAAFEVRKSPVYCSFTVPPCFCTCFSSFLLMKGRFPSLTVLFQSVPCPFSDLFAPFQFFFIFLSQDDDLPPGQGGTNFHTDAV